MSSIAHSTREIHASASVSVPETRPQRSIVAVCVWLLIIAAGVFAMVLVGGATRLTGSGLSITEWKPIMGAIPPLSDAAWVEAFQKYKEIPQYELVNKSMGLGEFKSIFWWEWAHRFLGRMLGFMFLLPFTYFLWRRSIPRAFIGRVALLFVLGGSQGALGWFMVQSGLVDRVSVSQYRLAAHLGLAVIIGGYALWLALSLRRLSRPSWAGSTRATGSTMTISGASLDGRIKPGHNNAGRFVSISVIATALVAAIYLQMLMGAIVAGLKAGHASDTWPLMQGQFVPPDLFAMTPWYLSIFEDPFTAHFIHRIAGYAVAVIAVACAVIVWRDRNGTLSLPITLVIAALIAQIMLGIATVVYAVPLPFALAHQANAVILFALALWFLHRTLTPPIPVPDPR